MSFGLMTFWILRQGQGASLNPPMLVYKMAAWLERGLVATWRELSPWEAARGPVLGTLLFSHLITQQLNSGHRYHHSVFRRKNGDGGAGSLGPSQG